MTRVLRGSSLAAPLALALACSSSSSHQQPPGGDDGGTESGLGQDAAGDAGADGPATPKIQHLIVIVQENHTFDNYFGRWCTAITGSNPTCTTGSACCEAGPAIDPGSHDGALDAERRLQRRPRSRATCSRASSPEIDGGKMDGFVTSSVCGSPKNFAYADTTVQAYWDPRPAGRAGRPLLPARRRPELVERHVPGARPVRLPRQHLRAAGHRGVVRARRDDDAVHRHHHRGSPRPGRRHVVLVLGGVRRDGAVP